MQLPRRTPPVADLVLIRRCYAHTMNRALLLLSCLALVGCVTRSPVSFQRLPSDQNIQVSFSSHGCFHSTQYDFEFRRNPALTAKVTGRSPLGTVTLSDREAAGLDRLLAFYSQPHLGGCTTVDHISVTLRKGGQTLFTKSYRDATCDTYDRKDFTTFPSIANKLESKRQ